MDFRKFSLYDNEIIKQVEGALGSDISLGFKSNEREGIINFPIIHKVGSKTDFKVSYTALKHPNIPMHSHERTRHIYAVMDGAMTVDVLFDNKGGLQTYKLGAFEGCFIPGGLFHTLGTEYAVLLCVEVPPDTNDFKLYEGM